MSQAGAGSLLENIEAALLRLDASAAAPTQFLELLKQQLAHLPLPGSGSGGTLQRWQALAAVGAHNLSLVKLYEGHTDALAILSELGHNDMATPAAEPTKPLTNAAATPPQSWGVWAAEMPGSRVIITALNSTTVQLNGEKFWCSGALTVSHGLLTAWHADGTGPQLVRVAMRQPGVSVSSASWGAVGMADSASVDVSFSNAKAYLVGKPGEYLSRPGFWQGGAGIAACWYGGAVGLALALHQAMADTPLASRSPFKLAALGKVDLALHSTAQLLRSAAQWIDANPISDASSMALRLRLSAEACANTVLMEAGRALGAAAFCRNARFALAAADLPVFIRQSHADRDFAALAERVILTRAGPWRL